jgi:hypothetical protein
LPASGSAAGADPADLLTAVSHARQIEAVLPWRATLLKLLEKHSSGPGNAVAGCTATFHCDTPSCGLSAKLLTDTANYR